jgi:hypothetical protein
MEQCAGEQGNSEMTGTTIRGVYMWDGCYGRDVMDTSTTTFLRKQKHNHARQSRLIRRNLIGCATISPTPLGSCKGYHIVTSIYVVQARVTPAPRRVRPSVGNSKLMTSEFLLELVNVLYSPGDFPEDATSHLA